MPTQCQKVISQTFITPQFNGVEPVQTRDFMEENIVYIGKKPSMNYVLAVATQFNAGADAVTIKARGRSISKAVDVTEIVRNRFMVTAELEDIKIGTERVEDEDSENGINVSWIEIVLKKGNEPKN